MPTTPSALKLFGVPLSQPFRAVAWTLLQTKTPFQLELCVPGATNRMGSRHESFTSRTNGRTNLVPILQVTNNNDERDWYISESAAILTYICESHTNSSNSNSPFELYAAAATRQKTLIDSYLHWHHGNTRQIQRLSGPHLVPDLYKHAKGEEAKQLQASIHQVLQQLDQSWLGETDYIAGDDPSIADLQAYEEIIQAVSMHTLPDSQLSDYERIRAWMARLKQLPFYEATHTALTTLGPVVGTQETTPLAKRLGVATKAGMQALIEAQKSY